MIKETYSSNNDNNDRNSIKSSNNYTNNTNICNVNCNLPYYETFSEKPMLPHLIRHFLPQKHPLLWVYNITNKNDTKDKEPHQVMFPEVLFFAMKTNLH